MDNKLASVGRAFVTGGAICACIQVIMDLLAGVLPAEAPLALRGAIALVIAGVITVVLVQTGIYGKISEFGGMGADLPFIGLAAAVTNIMCGARAQGAPTGAAIGAALKVMALLFGVGFAFCIVFAFVTQALGAGIFV